MRGPPRRGADLVAPPLVREGIPPHPVNVRTVSRLPLRLPSAGPHRRLPRLSIALACAPGRWPHDDWPAPDDGYVGSALLVPPPYRELRETEADVVVLRCEALGVVRRAAEGHWAP